MAEPIHHFRPLSTTVSLDPLPIGKSLCSVHFEAICDCFCSDLELLISWDGRSGKAWEETRWLHSNGMVRLCICQLSNLLQVRCICLHSSWTNDPHTCQFSILHDVRRFAMLRLNSNIYQAPHQKLLAVMANSSVLSCTTKSSVSFIVKLLTVHSLTWATSLDLSMLRWAFSCEQFNECHFSGATTVIKPRQSRTVFPFKCLVFLLGLLSLVSFRIRLEGKTWVSSPNS